MRFEDRPILGLGATGRRKEKSMRVFFARALPALLLGLFGACHTTRVPNERFTLVWRDAGRALHVRFSEDGNAWATADVPAVHAEHGPGVAADPAGTTFLVASHSPAGHLQGLWGVGTNNYARFAEILAENERADGAVSVAHARGSRWLFAFRRAGRARVLAYDAAERKWSDVTPTMGANNLAVQGRPCVLVHGDRVVLTWFRGQEPIRELQVVPGDLDRSGAVTWRRAYVLPNREEGFGAPAGPHALAHDHAKFLLGVLRPDVGVSGELPAHTLFVYESEDGAEWRERTRFGARAENGVALANAPVGLAAHSDGKLLAVHNSDGGPRLLRHDGSAWRVLPANPFVPRPQPRTEIALAASGRP
jgi:hypothetical protein